MQNNRKTKEIDLKIKSEINQIPYDEGQYFQVKIYDSVDAVLKIARLSVLKCIKETRMTHSDECYEAILYPDENYDVGFVKNAIEVAMREDLTYNYSKERRSMIKGMLSHRYNSQQLTR